MRSKFHLQFILHLFIIFSFTKCYKNIYLIDSDVAKDGNYDSEFPSLPCAEELEKISRSVNMISSIAFYQDYQFTKGSKVTTSMIEDETFEKKAIEISSFQKPAVGTATIVFYRFRKIAVLTCAHVINFPDTVISYFSENDGSQSEFIQSIAIKSQQNNHIIGISQGNNFEILAVDQENDLAILGKTIEIIPGQGLPVFTYPKGKAEELKWSNFIYVMGFPKGKKMLSTGVISGPPGENKSIFYINTPFNRGSSGGPVFAIRDGVPNFELVGIVKSVSAEMKPYLAPAEDTPRFTGKDFQEIFNGESIIKTHENIFYGVTYVVAIEVIEQFIEDNRINLAEKGFDIDQFFPGGSIN